jgi:hypothetical protein
LLQLEKECEATALDVLHNKCAVQDVFADSRFLKQDALQVRDAPAGPCTCPVHGLLFLAPGKPVS